MAFAFKVSNTGTEGEFAPQMKRAVGRHPDGRTIVVVPDTNLAALSGADDVTGVMKIRIYASTSAARNAFSLLATVTPPVAASSATKKFIGSVAIGQDGDVFIAYVGTDDSLRFVSLNWNAASAVYDAPVFTTVLAATAVTNRFRAVDVDVQWNGTASVNPAIAYYEANASSGVGTKLGVMIQRNDASWVVAYQDTANTTHTIRSNSEDVAICWGRDGIVTNVGRLAFYYTRSYLDVDQGDVVKEISFNVSTGTANSATSIGNWFTGLNAATAAGTRRGFLFGHLTVGGNPNWVFGTSVGLAAPFFAGYKLHHNTFTGIVENKTIVPAGSAGSAGFVIKTGAQYNAYMTANFSDNALEFVFPGVGIGSSLHVIRSVVLKWPTYATDTCEGIDTVARIKDGNIVYGDQRAAGTIYPVGGVYGGSNSFPMNSVFEFSTSIFASGNAVNNTLSSQAWYLDAEDVLSPPSIVFPSGNPVTTNKVTFQISARNASWYCEANGRVWIQIASNSGFSTGVRDLVEPPPWTNYSSSDGISVPTRYVNVQLPDVNKLSTGTWYARVKMIDDLHDLSSVSNWSGTTTFTVSHPPSAIPLLPAEGSNIRYNSGDLGFSWIFSDANPGDMQSAYRLTILRKDTGASVLDTGKVLSNSTSVAAFLTATLKDVPLSWSVMLWDGDDAPGAFSTPVNFVVADPPIVTIVSPPLAATVSTALPTVSWNFAAGGTRTQKAYRVRIYNTDATPDIIVGDSGWVTSTSTGHTFNSQILVATVNYRAEVQVTDSTDQSTIDTAILNGNPYFEVGVNGWTATGCTLAQSLVRAHEGLASGLITPSAACDIQSITYPATAGHKYDASTWAYSALGWNALTVSLDWRNNVDTSIGTDVFSNTLINAAWTQYVKSAVAPAGTTGVRIKVAMTGAPTATNQVWVDEVIVRPTPIDFTAAWSTPTASGLTVSGDKFKAIVHWTNAGQDADFVAWRVYRRWNRKSMVDLDVDNTRNTWVMQYETRTLQAAYDYYDYTAPLNRSVDYAVVQVVDRFGSLLESSVATFQSITLAGDRYYFVPAVPMGGIASFEASSITDDDFSLEVEQETLHVIGRGRQVQTGDRLGYDGQYTIKLRNPATARIDREFFELLALPDTGNVYIRSPFGDVIFASIGNPSFKRMAGMGLADVGDLTIPYVEVFEDAQITRVA